jgi:hypothetical protein
MLRSRKPKSRSRDAPATFGFWYCLVVLVFPAGSGWLPGKGAFRVPRPLRVAGASLLRSPKPKNRSKDAPATFWFPYCLLVPVFPVGSGWLPGKGAFRVPGLLRVAGASLLRNPRPKNRSKDAPATFRGGARLGGWLYLGGVLARALISSEERA